MKLLADEGADCNAPAAKYDGRTALEAAGEYGRIDMIQFLLAAPTAPTTTGPGQLQYLRAVKRAERQGHVAAAQLLRSHRAWNEEDYRILGDMAFDRYGVMIGEDDDDSGEDDDSVMSEG